jgi:pilus assembly protein CpaB
MRKQYVAVGLAALLAGLGIIVLVSYANSADERARAGITVRPVLQVVGVVPKGTAAADLGDKVKVVKLPTTAIAPGALADLDEVQGLSTTVQLEEGEQLLSTRFAEKTTAKPKVADSGVPDGMQELTIPLTKSRLVGGVLKPLDQVGVIVSYPTDGKLPAVTNMVQSRVLILRINSIALQSVADEQMLVEVTVAVKTLTAEKIVHGLEFGKVYLTKQTSRTDVSGGKTVDSKDVAP